jgi:hypothetical protein
MSSERDDRVERASTHCEKNVWRGDPNAMPGGIWLSPSGWWETLMCGSPDEGW